MELVVLHKTSRGAVIEILGEDPYETEPYEIWVNGSYVRRDSKMIFQVDGLLPAAAYTICLKRNNKEWSSVNLDTEEEFVTLNVRQFGAKGDGAADDTAAIQAAILSCPPKSRVYIPKGTYQIRHLFLKSDLTLEIGQEAVLQAFQKREEFPVLPGMIQSYDEESEYNLGSWEGNPLDTMVSIITGINVKNVVICGAGTIDGGGDFKRWWIGDGNKKPPYRPRMIFLNHCENVVICGVTIKNSPSWNVHTYFSENIRVYGITLESPDNSSNTDGIDPESCRNVEIAGVHFSVGDDCIALKSGKIYMGKKYKRPCEKVNIRQCFMEKGHGAITLGSEIAGGVKDVYVSKCLFKDTDRGLRIKTRRGRGKDSVVDKIVFENVRMNQVKSPFVVNCFYFCDPDGKSDYVASQSYLPADERTPVIRHLQFSNIICENAHHTGVCIYGLPEQKVESVRMKDVRISFAEEAVSGVSAMMRECKPSCRLGINARNVKELVLENVQIENALKKIEMAEIDEYVVKESQEEG